MTPLENKPTHGQPVTDCLPLASGDANAVATADGGSFSRPRQPFYSEVRGAEGLPPFTSSRPCISFSGPSGQRPEPDSPTTLTPPVQIRGASELKLAVKPLVNEHLLFLNEQVARLQTKYDQDRSHKSLYRLQGAVEALMIAQNAARHG